MTDKDHEDRSAASAPGAKAGPSRRGLLRTAGGLGIAGVAGGLLFDTTAGLASAATTTGSSDASHARPAASDPVIAHVHNARTGEVDLYTGEQHVRVHNPALARALAHAAATGR